MNRSHRIRVVVVATLGLLALMIGLIGAPLVAVMFAPSPADMAKSMASFIHVIELANQVSMICLAVAGCCMLYLLMTLAVWFIGPKEEALHPAEQSVNLPID
jgi:hypothetical protein